MRHSSLSVGDVVSAGIRIYRDRFQPYFQIALIGTLWGIVPIYGWAKSSAASTLITRLGFWEVREQPETVAAGRKHVDPQMWKLLGADFLVGLGSLIVFLVIGIAFAIFFAIANAILGDVAVIFVPIFVLAIFIGFIWLYSRICLVKPILGIESNRSIGDAFRRSWQLTQGLVMKLQLIFFVAFLIAIPISIVLFFITTIILGIIAAITNVLFGGNPNLAANMTNLLTFPINLGFQILTTALFVPFWQCIISVLYYDIRSRKEGIDLQV